MTIKKILKSCVVALVMSGLLTAQAGVAFANSPQTKVADVELGQAGLLRGQVVTAQGVGLSGATVSVQQDGKELIQLKTDAQGRFAARGFRGGTYVVATEGAAGMVRAWTPQTAPPAAADGLLLVPSQEVTLGQGPLGGLDPASLARNPGVWLVGGMMGAVLTFALDDPDAS